MLKYNYCKAGGSEYWGKVISLFLISLHLSAVSGPADRPRPSICEDKPNWASQPPACDQWCTQAEDSTH